MIRRKPIEDEDDNPERWLVSYADLMYGISSVNVSKYESISKSMGSAFVGNQGAGQTEEADNAIHQRRDSFIKPLPQSQLSQTAVSKERKTMQDMGKNVAKKMTEVTNNESVRVFEIDKGVRIDISERLLFEAGHAKIKTSGEKVLLEIAKDLAKSRKYVQVEGHTDINPIHTKQFPSNWELSTARATSVLRTLVQGGVLETRLSAVGYGASQPLNVIDTPEALEANRRVSIIALYESANPSNEGTEITIDSETDTIPPLIIMPGKKTQRPNPTTTPAGNTQAVTIKPFTPQP